MADKDAYSPGATGDVASETMLKPAGLDGAVAYAAGDAHHLHTRPRKEAVGCTMQPLNDETSPLLPAAISYRWRRQACTWLRLGALERARVPGTGLICRARGAVGMARAKAVAGAKQCRLCACIRADHAECRGCGSR